MENSDSCRKSRSANLKDDTPLPHNKITQEISRCYIEGFSLDEDRYEMHSSTRGADVFSGKEINTRISLNIGAKSRGNKLYIGNSFSGSLTIQIRGNNNIVYVGDDASLPKSKILIKGHDGKVLIGNSVTCTSNATIVCGQNDDASTSSILIGDGGMWAKDVSIYSIDLHPIFDLNTGNRINLAKRPVTIEPHVWLGQEVKVMKNAHIGAGSAIGAGSIVTRRIPRYAIAAGIPAKVVRTETFWARHEGEIAMTRAREIQRKFPPQ